ncbi:hypothetical protein HAX54_013576 [Datura stramonium]|uniref:Disease resistance protein winged helix domain-containing protein n=1 Tax=Datura stramonium TaxID=4076 RepID=A0ABS8RYI6_DATST|nr:hypothetical protein [Datura stramonium]
MEIRVSKLIRLWIAELFVKARSNKGLEVVAEEYLEELIDRSLIFVGRRRANGRIRTCRIHDLLRQLGIREAQIENVVHVINENVPILSEAINYQRRVMVPLRKHVYLPRHGSGVTSTTRSLVFTGFSYSRDTVPADRPCFTFSHFKLLTVLDVLATHHCFSSVISQLVHLRYVAAKIDKAPSLYSLRNLQTIILDTLGTRHLELPLEIWTMSE